MKPGIYEIHVRRHRKKLSVQTFGRTPRGTKFRKESEVLKAVGTADPEFKTELAAAVVKLMYQQVPLPL